VNRNCIEFGNLYQYLTVGHFETVPGCRFTLLAVFVGLFWFFSVWTAFQFVSYKSIKTDVFRLDPIEASFCYVPPVEEEDVYVPLARYGLSTNFLRCVFC